MTPDPTPADVYKILRGVWAVAATAAGAMVCVGGVLWTLHTVALAQAERITKVETKVEQFDRFAGKLDRVAEDVSAIREAQAVERGRRLGLLQSLPGVEGE